jgi:hypothetical protein
MERLSNPGKDFAQVSDEGVRDPGCRRDLDAESTRTKQAQYTGQLRQRRWFANRYALGMVRGGSTLAAGSPLRLPPTGMTSATLLPEHGLHELGQFRPATAGRSARIRTRGHRSSSEAATAHHAEA